MIGYSYGNISLYETDLTLLDPPNWINDHIISFYCEYLNNEFSDSNGSHRNAFCVDPNLSFWLLHNSNWEECRDCLKTFPFETSSCLLFPLNDSKVLYCPESPLSGIHWTLVAFIPSQRLFLEYDSMNRNVSVGQHFAQKLVQLYYTDSSNYSYIPQQVPPQVNSYDCGMYVLIIMELYVQYAYPLPDTILYEILSPNTLVEKRRQLKQLIKEVCTR
eukprot:jgi/Galph1/5205/GphlegSOOS_G3824.1